MKHTRTLAIGGLAAASLISPQLLLAQTEPIPPSYIVYDTGTLGGTFAFGAGINNLGWITGASTNASGALHATLAAPGTLIDLGTLGGSNSAVEWPVKNSHGLVVGISESAQIEPNGESFSCAAFIATNGHTCLPFLWNNGLMKALPLLGGNNGFATGINNKKVAVGWAETAQADPSCTHPQQVLQFLAVQWGPEVNEKRVLPPWSGDSTSAATAINESNEVVGISGDCGVAVGAFSARHALRWVNGRPINLPTLGGMGWNTPMAINNLGIIAGFSDTPGDVAGGVLTANFQAALWTPEAIINLHALPGDALGQATGINDENQVIGTSFPPAGSPLPTRAFLWERGRMYDLNKIVQPNAPLYLLSTGDINDHGEITGQGCAMPACDVLHTFVAIRAPRESGRTESGPDNSQSDSRPSMSSDVKGGLLRQGGFKRALPQRAPAQ